MKVVMNVISKPVEYVTILHRASLRDHEKLRNTVNNALKVDDSILKICDQPEVDKGIDVGASIYFNQANSSSLDFALMITQLIVSESFDLIIIDGYLPQLERYLPRLRWILHHYHTHLILFSDHVKRLSVEDLNKAFPLNDLKTNETL